MPIIKCLLVDDHILFRQGVRRLLEGESDVEVVGESSNAADAVLKAAELEPNVILMDIGMSGLAAFDASRQIHKDSPAIKIIFLTMYDDEEYLIQGLEAGAVGYVLKDAAASQLVTAVRETYRGGRYMSPRMLNRVVEEFHTRVPGQLGQPGWFRSDATRTRRPEAAGRRRDRQADCRAARGQDSDGRDT